MLRLKLFFLFFVLLYFNSIYSQNDKFFRNDSAFKNNCFSFHTIKKFKIKRAECYNYFDFNSYNQYVLANDSILSLKLKNDTIKFYNVVGDENVIHEKYEFIGKYRNYNYLLLKIKEYESAEFILLNIENGTVIKTKYFPIMLNDSLFVDADFSCYSDVSPKIFNLVSKNDLISLISDENKFAYRFYGVSRSNFPVFEVYEVGNCRPLSIYFELTSMKFIIKR